MKSKLYIFAVLCILNFALSSASKNKQLFEAVSKQFESQRKSSDSLFDKLDVEQGSNNSNPVSFSQLKEKKTKGTSS